MGTSILQSLITPLTESRNAYVGGQRAGQADQLKSALERYKIEQEQKSNAIKDALAQAQAGKLRRETELLGQPKPMEEPKPVYDKDRGGFVTPGQPFQAIPGIPQLPQTGEPIVPIVRDGKRVYESRSKAIGQEAPSPGGGAGEPGIFVDAPDQPGVKVYTPRSQAFGKTSTAAAGLGARGLGQGGVFGAGSGIGSVNEMGAVLPRLKEYEDAVATGQIPMNGWDTFRQGLLTHARGNKGFIDQGITQALIQNLAATNPALAEYATNQLAFIMADLNLSRGGTDERGRIATIVDGLALPVGAMDTASRRRFIKSLQERRDARYEGLKKSAEAAGVMLEGITNRGGKKAPAAPPAPAAKPPTYEEWKKANGIPDEMEDEDNLNEEMLE